MSERSEAAAGLPSTFEEFLEASDIRTCRSCGDDIQTRYIEDGRCVGCRHSPGFEDGGRNV
jgi:hypothetical protein